MAESRSKLPRACKMHRNADSSNSSVSGNYFFLVNNNKRLNWAYIFVEIVDQIGRNRSSSNREATAAKRYAFSTQTRTKLKLQRIEKDRQLSDSLNMESSHSSGPAEFSVMDSKEVLKNKLIAIDKSSKWPAVTFSEINRCRKSTYSHGIWRWNKCSRRTSRWKWTEHAFIENWRTWQSLSSWFNWNVQECGRVCSCSSCYWSLYHNGDACSTHNTIQIQCFFIWRGLRWFSWM